VNWNGFVCFEDWLCFMGQMEVFGFSFDYGLILNLVIWNGFFVLCVLGVFWKSNFFKKQKTKNYGVWLWIWWGQLGFECFINWFCSRSHLGISDLMLIGLKLPWNYLFLGVRSGVFGVWSDVRMCIYMCVCVNNSVHISHAFSILLACV
jgi:hypothetical protein